MLLLDSHSQYEKLKYETLRYNTVFDTECVAKQTEIVDSCETTTAWKTVLLLHYYHQLPPQY